MSLIIFRKQNSNSYSKPLCLSFIKSKSSNLEFDFAYILYAFGYLCLQLYNGLNTRVVICFSSLITLFIVPHYVCVTYPISFLQICRLLSNGFLGFVDLPRSYHYWISLHDLWWLMSCLTPMFCHCCVMLIITSSIMLEIFHNI